MTHPSPPTSPGSKVILHPGLLIVFEKSSEWCILLERANLMEYINDINRESPPTGEQQKPPWAEGVAAEHTWVWNCMWGSPPGPAHYASLADMGYGITETILHTILAHTESWTLEGDTLIVHEWRLIDDHDRQLYSKSGGEEL